MSHLSKSGQGEQSDTYHCKGRSGISREWCSLNHVGLGGNTRPVEMKTKCLPFPSQLTWCEVPLPFMVSSWKDGVNQLHLGQHSTGAQPLTVQMNDLWSWAAKTGQTGLNIKAPTDRYSENLGHIFSEHYSSWEGTEQKGRRCDLLVGKAGPNWMEHAFFSLPHPLPCPCWVSFYWKQWHTHSIADKIPALPFPHTGLTGFVLIVDSKVLLVN